jgi:hypothetical protein
VRREESIDRRRFLPLAGALVAVIAVALVSLALVWKRPVPSRLRARALPSSPAETAAEDTSNANVAGFHARAFEAPAATATANDRPRPRPTRRAIEYDRRSFDEMEGAWRREADDPERSLNAKTFVGALIETLDEGADAQAHDGLSVRCKQTVCRLDGDPSELMTLAALLGESRQEQYHVTYNLSTSDAGDQVEAYLGRERADPSDQP